MDIEGTDQKGITVKLESYESIFSDFDPRPFAVRALSDDFLIAIKQAVREADTSNVHVTLFIPRSPNDKEHEKTILERIKSHFHKHHTILEKARGQSIKQGILLMIVGMAAMIGATFLASRETQSFLLSFPRVLLEPTGWFVIWFGLDKIFSLSKEERENLNFYKQMAKAQLSFMHF